MIDRRRFLGSCLGASAGAAAALSLPTPLAAAAGAAHGPVIPDLRRRFPEPVRIRSVELVRSDGQVHLRATSEDGGVGVVRTNDQLRYLHGILRELVIPFFVGKDARDLEQLVDGVYRHARNYKYAGMPFWNCVGHVEIALFDLLGRSAGLPVGELLGRPVRDRIPTYVTRLTRETTAEEEVRQVSEALARTGARAVKIKVGGRMSNNADASPGRTKRLIPLLRRAVGDAVTIYADANGSYDVAEGIRIGRLLEDHGVAIYEEPCPWQEYENTRRVTDALRITIAGGEQDSSLPQWEWMIRNRVVDLVQPDMYYNGGLIRALQVARMAAAAGMRVAPHAPTAGIAAGPFLHFASVVPNLGGFQEYRAEAPEFRDGHVPVPTGPGLGDGRDVAFWSRAEVV
jgi:L-alanine-DL-glutamate epimerase-like enolase superfamily enzyme